MRPAVVGGAQARGTAFVANVLRSPAPLEYYGTPELWPSSIDVEFSGTNFCATNDGALGSGKRGGGGRGGV